MVIGNNKYDDVELMRGKSVPAERLELDGKVSLFDFSKENQQKLVKWENLDTVMLAPEEFYGSKSCKRVRDSILIEVTDYLGNC